MTSKELSYNFKNVIYKAGASISPKLFLKLQVRRLVGYWPDLNNPKTYNEKLNWYKLYYHDPLMTRCADKYAMRGYLEELGLGEYQNQVYGVYERVEDIDFDKLPNQFVLKSTHGSAQTIICRDKNVFDRRKALEEMSFWLKTSHYYVGCEWAYKDIKPGIICEELIKTKDGSAPNDYKIFCFNGEPKFILLCSGRIDGHANLDLDYYDTNWNHMDLRQGFPNSKNPIVKPTELEKILHISRILSKDFPHVRVDFYIEDQKIMVGELTFYHYDGYCRFTPQKYDELFGDYFTLPAKRL